MMNRTGGTAGSRVTVPAAHGKAVRVTAGSRFKVINTHGQQVVDFWAFNADESAEFMSMDHTRSILSKVNPTVGDKLVTNRRRPILTMVEDTSPGIHDTLLCPCNAAIYAELGCEGYHRSCEDNLHEALGELGIRIAWTPASLNLFMNVPFGTDGAIDREPPRSRPGDYVLFVANMDAVVVLSACPQDRTVINGEARQPRDVEVVIID